MLKLRGCKVKKSYTFFKKTANYIICVKMIVVYTYFNTLGAYIYVIL